jgi:hypothetical protein
MSRGDPSKAMLIVSAPKGTSLEVGQEEKGDCVLKMDSSGKGPIKVYSCKLNEGVKEVPPKRL